MKNNRTSSTAKVASDQKDLCAIDVLWKLSWVPTIFGGMKEGRLLNVDLSGATLETKNYLRVGDYISLRLENTDVSKKADKFSSGIFDPRKIFRRNRVSAEITTNITYALDPRSEESRYVYEVAFMAATRERGKVFVNSTLPWMALILFVLGTINVIYLKSFNVKYFNYQVFLNSYSLVVSFYILSRFFFSCFYRPPKYVGYLPNISVIIACFNEGDSIRKTIDCIYKSDYPSDRIEVIAVNDGSTDNTLDEMRLAGADHRTLKVINFEKNLGKRHGMAAGTRAARGEILVFIDSDSFVERHTLRKLVQGFVNREVGAICGHANVTNTAKNFLTKMQQVRYFVAFRIIKAAESIFSTVACCSGCLAAYRREYVMEILDQWLNQTFLGNEATFGDDRSLTNYMLKKYRVIYDSEAVCTTIVPEKYGKFFRQQLRWKKSWLRETLIGCRFMWKRHPVACFFYYLGAMFPLMAPIVILNALVFPLFTIHSLSYVYIYGAFLMAMLYSLVYLIFYRDRVWLYGIAFSFFYMTVLVWQTYYAMFTVRRNHWGTR